MNRYIGIFGVRNDSSRGIIIESLQTLDKAAVYFFKYNDQPLSRHCEQVQNIIRKADVKRAKKIQVDLSEFLHEYWNDSSKRVEFRGTKLNSVDQQIAKVHELRVSKEIGATKRAVTMAAKKKTKELQKKQKILVQMEEKEQKFQAERIKYINEVVDLKQQANAHTQAIEAHNGTSQPPENSDIDRMT